MTRKNVVILVFPDVELLDFCGPYEVLSRLPPRCRAGAGRPRPLSLCALLP